MYNLLTSQPSKPCFDAVKSRKCVCDWIGSTSDSYTLYKDSLEERYGRFYVYAFSIYSQQMM